MMKFIYVMVFSVATVTGVNAMSFLSGGTELEWEWPADREILYKVVVEVVEIKPKKSLLTSPSIAENIPDPVILRGKVVLGDPSLQMTAIRLVMPKVELGNVVIGSRLALGLVDKGTVVCSSSLPLDLGDSEEMEWLSSWVCK